MKRTEAFKFRAALDFAAALMTDKQADEHNDIFPAWKPNTEYGVGDRRRHDGLLYRCVQAHTSQDGWTPDITPALWTRCSVEEWPEWIRPTGAQDAYNTGDKVTYEGKHYVSLIDNNTWSPAEYPAGWQAA